MPPGKARVGIREVKSNLWSSGENKSSLESVSKVLEVVQCKDVQTAPQGPSSCPKETCSTCFSIQRAPLEEETFLPPDHQRFFERQQTLFALTLTPKKAVFLIVYVLPPPKLFTILHELCLDPEPRLFWLLHFHYLLSSCWFLQETKTFLCIRCRWDHQRTVVRLEQGSAC